LSFIPDLGLSQAPHHDFTGPDGRISILAVAGFSILFERISLPAPQPLQSAKAQIRKDLG
jgi:hypothetical protein